MLDLQTALIERIEHKPDPRKKLKPRKKMKGESDTKIINLKDTLGWSELTQSSIPTDSLIASDPTDPQIAWAIEADLIKAGHSLEIIDALIAEDMAVRWEIPGSPTYLVLTAWGMWKARVAIKERWIPHEEKTKEGVKNYAVEVPCWLERSTDSFGDPTEVDGPVHQPQHANEVRLPFPEEVIDKRQSPEQEAIAAEEFKMRDVTKADGRLDVDPKSGKVRRTEVLLFPSYSKDKGKMKIDNKMKGKGATQPKPATKPPKVKGTAKPPMPRGGGSILLRQRPDQSGDDQGTAD
jgi:hypothetical protein